MQQRRLSYFAWLSIATAVFTMALKAAAYQFTGSVGLLSDALESGVNLVTAVFALLILRIASRPPDEGHSYGHSKAEYLSVALEGGLILLAAFFIGFTAVQRLLAPQPLEQLGLGLAIAVVASAANALTSFVLIRAGRAHRSVTLVANGRHLLTDVWTTGGVLLGLLLVWLTDWLWLDPLIALLVAAQICYTGFDLLRDAIGGLMDGALPEAELRQVTAVLDQYASQGMSYHALRTRRAGAQRFVSVHIQVPGHWSVQQGHRVVDQIEQTLSQQLAPLSIITHLEPMEDPASWDDVSLNREIG